METISYEYEGALYVNLTNRCDCACVFCLRHNGHKGSIYADDLWLEHEPTREEALADIIAHHPEHYRELVFCGFGEPTYRLADLLWLVDRLREQVKDLPPVRINTNGHANLIQGRDVIPDLKGRIDTLSISLNANTAGGVGFTAITVAWLAQLNPFAMVGISVLLAVLDKGADTLQTQLAVPASISDIITGIFLFCMLGCEFFINYRLIFRGSHKEVAK